MSVEQTNVPEQQRDPAGRSASPEQALAPSTNATSLRKHGFGSSIMQFCRSIYRWLLVHTFTPSWLPKRWHSSATGYVVAIILQILAVFATSLFVRLFPTFVFTGLLEVLALALVALNWGAGPSIVATFVGAVLLDFFILPPHFAWSLDTAKSIVEILLFLLVGFTLSVVASRIERIRQDAEALTTTLTTERARLEAVIETVPGAVSIHDISGNILKLNRMGLQNAGVERSSETLADSSASFSVRTPSGAVLPVADFPVTKALQGEVVTGMKLRYLDADGQDRFSSMSAAPLHDSAGEIEGAILITHDITDLYLSEREAAARASELEAIFESITDGVFVYGIDQKIIRMNPAFRELIGLHTQNEDAFDALSSEERRTHLAMRDENGLPLPLHNWPQTRILRGEVLKDASAAEVLFSSFDDHAKAISVSGAPIRNQDGQIIAALCICRDVTERRQLERRTAETLKALLAMAETLVLPPDDVAPRRELTTQPLDASLKPVNPNKIAHRMAELTCSVLGCKRMSITVIEPETEILSAIAVIGLSPEQERKWWAEQPQGVHLRDGADPTLLERLLANDVLVLDMTKPPLSDAPNPYNISEMLVVPMSLGNSLVGFFTLDHGGVSHDYTPDEIALAKAVAKLTALVIERERLLRERADARANELALREANRRMDEFLGMTSHELKTPLTSIKGNTQLTLRQLRSSMQNMLKMQEMIGSSERQIRLLDRLVDDLLDISRTQSNSLQLSLAPYDLRAIVQEGVAEQQRIWPQRIINLTLPEEPTPIIADGDRITQVVTNYLTNAHKYSFDDSPIDVSLSLESDSVRVSVQDSGTGLTPEEQAHIWERFHRVHTLEENSSTHSSHGGLGLGLYICKTIIEQHGGSVGVESAPGSGSTFWFTLPLFHEDSIEV